MLKISKFVVGAIVFLCLTECIIWLSIYTESNCWYSPEADSTFQLVYHKIYITFYASTAILVLVLTTLIAIFLVIHQRSMKSIENSSARTSQNKEARITLMLFVVSVTFLFSTLSELLGFIATAMPESQTQVDIWTAAWVLLILFDLYHSTNFVIYVVFLEQFRKYFVRLFKTSRDQ